MKLPTYLWVLAFLFVYTLDLKADDKTPPKAPMANFGATNYPCNTKMPWVDSSFNGLTASIIDPASNGLSCTGSNSGTGNLLDASLNNSETINFTLGLGGCNSTLSVVDNDAADTYPIGTFAGFRIGTAGLLGVSIGSSITITTYNNGSPVESHVVVSSGLGLNSSLLNGDGTATVGFIATLGGFDEIRITYQSLISALFTGTIYHAVVQRYCAGPSLGCNVQTQMNNPTFPTIIQASHTGITGGVCAGCSVNNAENAVSSSTADFATIVLTAALGTTGSIGVKDQVTTHVAGSFAGFDISNPNLISANLLSGLIIRTYLNGVLRDSSNATTLLSAGSTLLSGSGRQIVGLITTMSFNEVRISATNLLGVASTTNVYGAIFQSFCQGPALACNVQTGMNNPVFPTFIDNARTGITGTACVSCSVNNTQNVNNSNTSDFGTIILAAAVGTTGSIAVKEQITDYPAGTFAGFDISNPNLINANVLSGIIIRTYLNGVRRDSSTTGSGGTLVSAGSSLLTGGGRQIVGIVTTLSFDEVRISVTNLLGVTSTTNVYGAIFQSFCAGPALTCNTPTALTAPTYPVMINGSKTGFSGVACVACSIDSTQNIIDASTSNRATVSLTGGVLAVGSVSVKEQITTYPAGAFAGFEIENTSLVGLDLLDHITIVLYNNGVFVDSLRGQNNLLSVNTSLLTDNGRRIVGMISPASFDEVQIKIYNTAMVSVGVTRIYSVLFESFCAATLACNTTYYLNNPTFPVIINDERTGIDGAACVGCSVQDAPAVISANNADYATITTTLGALAPPSISVKAVLGTFPVGSMAGFVIRDVNTLLQLELFNSITVSTYLDGVFQEDESGSGLLDLALLGLLNVSLTGSNDYNIGFKTTLPYDEIQISVGSLASLINIIRVYGAFVDTRGSHDAANLNCCPTTAPTLSGNTISNPCPVTTANLNSLVTNVPPMAADSTVRWFTNSGATGTPYATPTAAVAGTYYAFFFDTVDSCYGPASGAVTVTVSNCPPTITSNGAGATASISVPENTTVVTTVTATDPENAYGTPKFSITGGADAALFTINATTGVLVFNTAHNFESPTDANADNNYEVTVRVTDAGALTDEQAITVTVTNVLEDPIITSDGGGTNASISIPENTTAVTTVVATDPDGGAITYSITGGADAALFTINPTTGVLTFNALPDFENPTDVGTNNVYNVQVTATDPSTATDVQNIAVTVTNVNEAPTITSNGAGATASISVPENTTAVTTVTATDPENAYGTPKFSITGGADAALFTINATTGVLVFNTAHNFESPTDANADNNYEVTVRVTDAGALFDEQAITVTITNVLEDPIITSNGGGTNANISIPENTTAVTTVVATDPDGGAITYSITGGADAALFTINATTGVLTFNAPPDFENPTDVGTNNVYNVQVTATDPSTATDVQNIAVTVTNVNEAPTITSNGAGATASISVPENTTAVTTVTATDPENAYGTPKFSISGGADAALFTINPTTGVLVFNATHNFESPTDANADNNYEVTVRVTDAGTLFDEQAITVTITNVLEAPIITSNGGGNNANISIPENTTAVTTVVATDPDGGAITYSITGGADAALFTINPTTGALTFNAPPDFENPTDANTNNIYLVEVTATDPSTATDVQDIFVTVTNVNEPPTITSNGGGATATVSIAENTTAVTTVTAIDPENAYGTPKFSISGGADAALFTINATTGVLAFNATHNFESPTDANADNNYEVTVRVTDAGALFDDQAITVTITNVLENPIITSNGGGTNASISIPENTTAVTTVVATDPDNGAITYSITGGADAALFTINPTTGVLTFNAPPDFENPTDVGTNNVYNVQVTATDPSTATDVQNIAVTVTDVPEAGPALACNTPTLMNNPTHPTVINGARTGISGTLCVLCAVNNPGNVISSSTTDFASIVLTLGLGTTGSISVQDPATDYPAGTFVGFDIENTDLLGTNLLDGVTITTYSGGNFVQSFTGPSALLSVGSSLLTNNGRRVIGFVSTLPFDEAQISLENTGSVSLGTTRVYGAVFESFCDTTLACNTTYNLNNPDFSVIVNDSLSGLDGIACVGCSVANAPHAISADTTDFATLTVITGTSATASLSVRDVLNTFPAGSTVGFTIQDVNTLAQVNLLSSIEVCTYNNGTQQECTTGNDLLDLSLLNMINASLNGAGDYNLGFRSTLPYDEVRITVEAVAGVSNIIRVYGAFVDTRGSQDGNLNCCPTTAPTLSGNTITNSCPVVTVNLNSLVTNVPPMAADSTVRWFTNSGATGTPYATPTAAVAGTYYAFFFDTVDSCYGPASGAVTVTVSNCPPTITSNGAGATATIPVAENTTAVTTVTATDPENAYGTPKFSITGGADAALFTINATTGVLAFNATHNFESPTDANADNNYEVTIRVTDAGSLFDEQAITVTITNVLEAPIITSNGGGNNANISIPENTTAVTTVVATDPDGGAITYSITGGADAALFTINPTTGALTFNTAPDFENPTDANTNNVYLVEVTATDPSTATDVQDIFVTVTNVNEPPTITSNGGGATATVSIAENTTAVTTVTATDPENAYGTPKFSISGGADAALFTINATTGVLAFNATHNFESPTDANADNNYEVTVRVTDAGALFDDQAITVTVTNVLEAPIITSNGGGTNANVSVPENTTAVTTVVATDPDGGAITYSITGGTDAAFFTINPTTGALTFNAPPDYENPMDAGTNNVYNVQVTATDPSTATDVQNIAVTVTNVPEVGPALDCNTPTVMNNPTYPTVINGTRTGLSGGVCLLCDVDNTANVISSSTTDFATITLTLALGTTGSISVQDPVTDYAAGTFVGFDIENLGLLGTNLLNGVTISTYLNGNPVPVQSFTGPAALLSVGSSLLTNNGRRVIGFVSTAPFDEAQISLENTGSVSVGTTRVYGAVFERFCGTTLACNTTYNLNNPEFSVIVNDSLSGLDGVACIGCSVANAPNAISADTTDFATLTVITGTSATASLSVRDVLNTFPAGSTVGFTIRDVNTLAQVNLLSSIEVCTYNNGVQRECNTANDLLDLSLLNIINASLNGAGDYNLGFRSTLPYDEVRIIVSAVAGVSNIIRVYGAFVDTRGANDANLSCCPITAPTLSGNAISNVCPVITVNLNSLVTNIPPVNADSTVHWFTNNGATGTPYATPATAGSGTYYAFFYDKIDSCYGPASSAVLVTIVGCPPIIMTMIQDTVPENTIVIGSFSATDPEGDVVKFKITGGADAARFEIDSVSGVMSFKVAPDFENPIDDGNDNTYDVQVSGIDPVGQAGVYPILIFIADLPEGGLLSAKVFLQGALLSTPTPGIMRDNLRAGNYIPLRDPYTNSGNPHFAHHGLGGLDSTTTSVLALNAGTNNAIVDWVFLELRSPTDATVIVETRAALLQRDGDIVSPLDGISPVSFLGTVGLSYYVAIKHRNHLGVMTAAPMLLSDVGTIVNFSTMSNANVFNQPGYDGYEMITISGVKALWAGNANSDKKVKYQGPINDNATVLNQVLTFPGNTLGVFNYDLALGYFSGDLNLDGKVKYQGGGNDPGFMFLNLITNFTLNAMGLYNYDLFTEQIP